MTNEKKTSKPMMVRRVAGERGQGAGSLYCFGYTELADVLGIPVLDVVRAVNNGALEPLHLAELAKARRDGISSLGKEQTDMRPKVVSDVAVATPPEREPPCGLDTFWALTYADIADQLGLAPNTVRSSAKGGSKSLNIRSLESILDYVTARHPTLA